MLISIDWIKDFVELPTQDPQELGNRFTLGSAEVEEVVIAGEYLEQIRIAEVTKIEPHPEADKLNLVTFNYGESEPKRVVCGASNVRLGMKTPFAPLGTTLPIGFTLEPKKIRGVLSDGMLCSEEELGLSEKSSGIMDLPSEAPVGQSLSEYWGQKKDIIIDVDNKSLTHRPDMWGHFGIAREFAALFRSELKRPYDSADWTAKYERAVTEDSRSAPVKVKVDSSSSCLAYYGLSIDGVKVEASPMWMQNRLKAVGLRPINNIVDISNYVMLELGIPLHIFDRQKIQGDCVEIKKMGKEGKFITLDEIERDLLADDTVICDQNGPLVLAGIMGGLNSGVSDETTELFIEVANWKAAQVRRTSTRLGLRTDSSQRYEKTLDSTLCKRTMLRTLELILELCPQAKVHGTLQYDGEDLSSIKPLFIQTSADKISRVLGAEVPSTEVVRILSALDFKVTEQGTNLSIEVPSFRATKDIENEADIIEEIGRVIGYDNIASQSPLLEISPVRTSPAQTLERSLRDFLVYHCRATEVMTYPMIGDALLKKAQWPEREVDSAQKLKLINALSIDAEMMRPSLIPSFLQTASLNSKNFSQFRFFEIGRTYHKTEPEAKSSDFAFEKKVLAICFYDKEKNVFMDLVNHVDRLCRSSNLPAQLSSKHPKFKNEVVDEEWMGVHPFEFYNIRLMGRMKGVVMSLHPLLMREFKIKGHLSMALIDLTDVQNKELKPNTSYRPLSKYPSSSFDWTVVAASDVAVGDVLAAAQKAKVKNMADLKVVGVYQLSPEQNSITLRATFQNPDKTLDGEFLSAARDQLVSVLEKAGYPLKS